MDIRTRGEDLSASRTAVHSREAGRCCERLAQALQIKVPIVHQYIPQNICLITAGRFARSQDNKKNSFLPAWALLDDLKQWSRISFEIGRHFLISLGAGHRQSRVYLMPWKKCEDQEIKLHEMFFFSRGKILLRNAVLYSHVKKIENWI